MFSSIWLNFRPFPFIWLSFSSHRALQYSVISHIQRNPTNHCKQCGHIAPTHDRQLVASFGRRLHGAAGYTLRRLRSPLWLHSLPVTLAAGYALRPCDTLRRLHCPPVTLSASYALRPGDTLRRLHCLPVTLSVPFALTPLPGGSVSEWVSEIVYFSLKSKQSEFLSPIARYQNLYPSERSVWI